MSDTKHRIIIAVDGFSSCGKSTFAKAIAARLGYIFIDTGAMYRAVTLYALEHGAIRSGIVDEEAVVKLLDRISITFRFNPERGASDIYVNGDLVEGKIRTIEVSNCVSRRERHPRGAPQTGGHAAGDGPPPGRGDGRPGHRHGGVPRRRAETVYDGRHRRARLPPLQGADGQGHVGDDGGGRTQHPRARQGRHEPRRIAAAPGRRRHRARQQPHECRRTDGVVYERVPIKNGKIKN